MEKLKFDAFERCDEVPSSEKTAPKYDFRDIVDRFVRSDMKVARHTFDNRAQAAYLVKKVNEIAKSEGIGIVAEQRVKSVYLSRVK